jgi:HEPN domain-containing protein
MKSRSLAKDYVTRAAIRVAVLPVLFDRRGYADVVREAQEIVELVSRARIRHLGVDPARVHDVSTQLQELYARLLPEHRQRLETLIEHSRELRWDHELAFYGSEDLTPSEFYSQKDADSAFDYARHSVAFVEQIVC